MAFTSLPVELVDDVLNFLNLDDILNLRLTCQTMKILASRHSTFKRCFVTKRVELTRKGLEQFASLTEDGMIVSLLQDIVLVVVIYDGSISQTILKDKKKTVSRSTGPISMTTTESVSDDELKALKEDFDQLLQLQSDLKQLRKSQSDLGLLKSALCNIRTSHSGRLQSISLQAIVYQKTTDPLPTLLIHDWQRVWDEASYGYQLTLTALVQSTLPVTKLDCFTEIRRCSIPCNTLALEHIEPSDLQNTLQHLRTFHVSMVNRTIEGEVFRDIPRSAAEYQEFGDNVTIDPETWQNLRTSDENFTGMISLLRAMSSLENFSWHWYSSATRGIAYMDELFETMSQRVINAAILKSLRSCSLAGLRVSEDDLIVLLERSPELCRLTLMNVSLHKGTWKRVLDKCSSEETRLDYVYLDDLWEATMVWFEGPGRPKMPRFSAWGPSTLLRDGREEVRKPIVYHVATGRMLGSPQAYNWRQNRRLEYGPP